MVSDLLDDEFVPYTPGGLRRLGVKTVPSPSAMARWRLTGIRGETIETHMFGGRRMVRRRAVLDFIERVTRAADGRGDIVVRDSEMKQSRDVAAIEQELERDGL